MIIGSRFQSEKILSHYDVIIIGSGISGLTLAILQAKAGRRVLVLEKHYTAGGSTHTFKKKGYEWDTGLHYIGEVHNPKHPLRLLFDYLSLGNLQWAPLPAEYDRFIFPDKSYSFDSGKEEFIQGLLKDFPMEEKSLRSYLDLIHQMTKELEIQSSKKILPGVIQDMMSGNPASLFLKTTYDVLKTLTNNEKLISVLCALWGDYGLPPKQSSFGVHATIASHYLNGASFPVGGSSEIARTMVENIESHGGQVLINTGVKKVVVRGNEAIGVELENGAIVLGKKIISSAGVHQTYLNLFDEKDLPAQYLKTIKSVTRSSGYFSITLGVNEGSEILNHNGSNLWVYPGYDHDQNVKNYLKDPFNTLPPMNYISFPSLKDPQWKNRIGHNTAIDILGLLPYEFVKKWQQSEIRKRPEEYKEFKEKIAAPYFDSLYRVFPQLRGKIEYYETSSPLTVKHYLNYDHGEIYGAALGPDRFTKSILRPQTPVKNFYLTGQDILMNGVAGAMMAGVLTSAAISPMKTLSQLLPLGVIR